MDIGSVIIFALPLLLLFWIFSRSRKQQRAVAEQQAAAEPGRRVMMTSGLYGEIVDVEETEYGADTVVVEIAPGVRTTWARQAIARVLPVESEESGEVSDVVPGRDEQIDVQNDEHSSEQDTRPER